MSNGDFNMEEYAGLAETGFESRKPTDPEKEFFHSVYISGQTRENHIGIEEREGKLQIRGVEYNLDGVNMIVTNVKEVLVKSVITPKRQENVTCFSYKSGPPPWKGTTNRICGENSAQRAANEFCNDCRSQIIVSGVYCQLNGKPILNEEGVPVFVFLRGKGMKYSNISEYLNDAFKMELTPIFEPATEESKKFERAVVNVKRFVTNVSIGTASSNFGDKAVFVLKTGTELPKSVVIDILKISKKTLYNFNEKFDWSKGKAPVSGYGDQSTEVTPDQQFPTDDQPVQTEETKKEEGLSESAFNFDNIKF